mmetsp:Transcript_102846/g.320460  ORF Transcript_102846/g.320460 Transcript_102846/m.320460 type:complete len:229 (-) Transcript_102846:189-875(-)
MLQYLETFRVLECCSSSNFECCSSSNCMPSIECCSSNCVPSVEKKIVGRAMAAVAKSSIVTFVSATTVENTCRLFSTLPSLGVTPPAMKDMPSTSRRLERMLPRSVPFTTLMFPFLSERRVWTIRIISTALPKVAFSRPPMVSLFSPAASSSVASPMSLARGIMAKKFSQNTKMALHSRKWAATPMGKAKSSSEMGSSRISCRRPSASFGPCFQPRGCGASESSRLLF